MPKLRVFTGKPEEEEVIFKPEEDLNKYITEEEKK